MLTVMYATLCIALSSKSLERMLTIGEEKLQQTDAATIRTPHIILNYQYCTRTNILMVDDNYRDVIARSLENEFFLT